MKTNPNRPLRHSDGSFTTGLISEPIEDGLSSDFTRLVEAQQELLARIRACKRSLEITEEAD